MCTPQPLFYGLDEKPGNLLPHDGTVLYYGAVLPADEAWLCYNDLLKNIAWKNDEAMMFGKRIVTKRKVAWYADKPFAYTYSKTTKTALPWTATLQYLKTLCEQVTGATYNSCLLNLYHNGGEGMAWHSDDEKELDREASIASLSFGAERKFAFKHKRSGQTVALVLHHGSLLEMKGGTQSHWLHRLPPTKTVNTPRINLTFRKMAG